VQAPAAPFRRAKLRQCGRRRRWSRAKPTTPLLTDYEEPIGSSVDSAQFAAESRSGSLARTFLRREADFRSSVFQFKQLDELFLISHNLSHDLFLRGVHVARCSQASWLHVGIKPTSR
jgi:hypothetical protein